MPPLTRQPGGGANAMRPLRPCGLILATGPGSLKTRDPALVKLGLRTLVEEHVGVFRRAGIHEIAVVRRVNAAELPLGCGDVRVVLQPNAEATMFDALVLGLFALDRTPVLVLPVMNDVVGDDTMEMLVAEAHDAASSHAVVPRYGDQHGHPVVLLRGGVEAVVRDAADPRGLHRLDRLLAKWGGVRPLDVADDAVARTYDETEAGGHHA